jgi:hypothetical protein
LPLPGLIAVAAVAIAVAETLLAVAKWRLATDVAAGIADAGGSCRCCRSCQAGSQPLLCCQARWQLPLLPELPGRVADAVVVGAARPGGSAAAGRAARNKLYTICNQVKMHPSDEHSLGRVAWAHQQL